MAALSFWERAPPYALVALSSMAGLDIELKPDPKASKDAPPTLRLASGDELSGPAPIARYLLRAGEKAAAAPSSSSAAARLAASADPLGATRVDGWLDFAAGGALAPGPGFQAAAASLDAYLAPRSYLVGRALTAADVAVWGALAASPVFPKLIRAPPAAAAGKDAAAAAAAANNNDSNGAAAGPAPAAGPLPNLARWFDLLSSQADCAACLDRLDPRRRQQAADAASVAAGGRAKADGGSFDVALPGDPQTGAVVVRFPPEPSGYLHIGHAKAALLNQAIAERFQGKLLVRFDDTNPSKEKDEYVENILGDLRSLNVLTPQHKVTYASDYFPQLAECADRLIERGVLYADDTPVDQMREERMAGVPSRCRERPVAETKAAFSAMQRGEAPGVVLRLKMDMASANTAMRDPVAYRCNTEVPHWRTGTTYKAYPTYDYSCPFVDAIEGVTHALRTSEYRNREEQFYWVLEAQRRVWPGLPHVWIWDYARLNFIYTCLSKRKLTQFVDTGAVGGWDDPRMPTVQGVLRRGLTLPALREFILLQGASKNLTTQEWDRIWAINKRMVDPAAPRHTAVLQEGSVRLYLAGGPAEGAPEVAAAPKHKKEPSLGTKAVARAAVVVLDRADAAAVAAEVKASGGRGAEVTLMDWGNAVVEAYEVGPAPAEEEEEGGGGGAAAAGGAAGAAAGGAAGAAAAGAAASGAAAAAAGTSSSGLVVTALRGRLHLAGDVKRTKLKLTWLPEAREAAAASASPAPEAAPLRAAAPCGGLVPLCLSDFDYLITKKKVEEDDDFASLINARTRRDVKAWGDGNMAHLKKGAVLQLERKGFFVVDRPWGGAAAPDEAAVLLSIPDGRARPPPGEYFEAQARAERGVGVEAP